MAAAAGSFLFASLIILEVLFEDKYIMTNESEITKISDTTNEHEVRRPVVTWILMVLSVLSALALLDWSGVGVPKPFGFFFLPTLLGFVGMGFALHARRGGWALSSALLGVMMVPALLVIVLLISGP